MTGQQPLANQCGYDVARGGLAHLDVGRQGGQSYSLIPPGHQVECLGLGGGQPLPFACLPGNMPGMGGEPGQTERELIVECHRRTMHHASNNIK